MVPIICVLNHERISWESIEIYYHDNFVFGHIFMFLTSIFAHFCVLCTEAGSDPRGHLGVTWGVYLCAGKPPLADIILSHPPDLTRCDSVIGLATSAMIGHIQNRGTASGDLYIRISGINRVLLS